MIRNLLPAAVCLALMPAPAQAGWHVAQSKHFIVYSDDHPAELTAFATRLERFDKAVRVALNLPDPAIGPSGRLMIFIVRSTDDVERITGMKGADIYQPQSQAGAWAFFPQRSPNDHGRRTPSPLEVLQHAYTHRVLLGSWRDVQLPPWLSEGFAEFFATTKVRSDGSVVLGGLPEYRWDGIDQADVFPVERLVSTGPDFTDAKQMHVFIGRAWLLINYLTFDTDRSNLLNAYVAAIRSGKPTQEAAAILGVDAWLDKKLDAYGKRPTWPSAVLSVDEVPIDPVTTRALTTGEAAMIPVVMRLRSRSSTARPRDVLIQARAFAAPFVNDAAVQNVLAQAAYDGGDFALSSASADRALSADPRSVDAMIVKGRALAALAVREASDPSTWAAARSWFMAANEADPLYFFPLQLFYESFRAASQEPTPSARQALLHAYSLNPTNGALRIEAARIFLEDGDLDAARVALGNASIDEYGGAIAPIAARTVQALDVGGAAEALTALAAFPPKAD
ncbi:hypothetical protein [Allosphingosinicella vermicomposti]|uniref:hypothetical protein n=1 Tax=Allosphingosinicella vermicomposti TaxID=614671 RepID=UPI000D106673|nr:hypothetical protein [Allosphingosinicella vermicomposti]